MSKNKKTTSIHINLRAKPKETVGNVFVKWGVNSGKIIIIATELIALSALFYRFSIDRKIIDLNEEIKKEEIFIANQAAKEKEYRSVQKRLDQVQLITNETDEKVALLNTIITALKTASFDNTNIAVSHNTIKVSGNAISIFAVNSLIDQLKKSPKVDNIKLEDVSSTTDGVEFSILIELNSLLPDENAIQASGSALEQL